MPVFDLARPLDAPAWWSSDDWATPPALVAALEAEFGAFDLDPCARDETAQAPNYYTLAEDGLRQSWAPLRVFVNPPYSAPRPWIEKAREEAYRGAQVILLLPAATDTKWFHEIVLPYGNIRFLAPRIKFLGWDGVPVGTPKAGSMIVRFPKRHGDRRFHV